MLKPPILFIKTKLKGIEPSVEDEMMSYIHTNLQKNILVSYTILELDKARTGKSFYYVLLIIKDYEKAC